MKKTVGITIILISILNTLEAKPKRELNPKNRLEWIDVVKKPTPEIYGNWIWLDTDCCGIRHGLSTPESTNDNIKLELNNNKSFKEEHSKKKTLPRNGFFIVYKENNQDVVQFNDERPAQFTISENKDTLTLSWRHLELQTERYIRQK